MSRANGPDAERGDQRGGNGASSAQAGREPGSRGNRARANHGRTAQSHPERRRFGQGAVGDARVIRVLKKIRESLPQRVGAPPAAKPVAAIEKTLSKIREAAGSSGEVSSQNPKLEKLLEQLRERAG